MTAASRYRHNHFDILDEIFIMAPMVFKAEENVMELIWENLPKVPDKHHVTFTKEDIEEIWQSGFVDTDKYQLEYWIKLFEPHKQPDNTYVLKKEDFLEKGEYRYAGEIMIPFEPLIINEGKYTDEGLRELIDMSIAPSCSKSRMEIKKFFDEFKELYRGSDDLIKMDMSGKRMIAELIYQNPSPTRRRELLFDAMFEHHMSQITAGTSPLLKATPEEATKVQVSTFTTALGQSEKAARELKAIEKARATKTAGSSEGIEIKNVRKSRRGFRG